MKAFLRQTGSQNLQDTVDAWMEDYDTNNDGQLNYQEWRELFDLIDVDKSGAIDAEELIRFLNESGNGQLVAAVKNWIKEFDENCDGKLQYKEFLKFKLMSKLDLNGDGIITLGEYKVALNISSQPMDAWKSLFESLDKDGSGTVSADKLKAFLRQTGSQNLQDTVDAWMEDYDTNNDGQLNYQEFLGFIASLEC
ncbi:unnamed protein product [Schistocephalus solidus]|uniref:EF-hand domain-containing protein n=1 Tax=Schistocephalus solidus TaxID=70667 RepID=A0A3P7EZN5_SCHSO|nr:unnamed protein product [Schistocephalus solidus]